MNDLTPSGLQGQAAGAPGNQRFIDFVVHGLVHCAMNADVAVADARTIANFCAGAADVVARGGQWVVDCFSQAADADAAMSSCARIIDAGNLPAGVSVDGFGRLVAVLGVSLKLGMLMEQRASLVAAVIDNAAFASHAWARDRRIAALRQAVEHLPFEQAVAALRTGYRNQLAAIMAWDAASADPMEIQPAVSRALSDAADAALAAALDIAKASVAGAEKCRFAIIGMGKLGARELNYVSDVDLIYVVEPASMAAANTAGSAVANAAESSSADFLHSGTAIATTLQRICQAQIEGVAEPPLWEVDASLRPEGKDGALVRTLASHRDYYERWAQNWEFQALLKARFVAGDEQVGAEYERMAEKFVWSASSRPNFVFDCQKMRERVENSIAPALCEREMKLGKGGLRDIEFSVQMLQLVHGRTDSALRAPATLDGLAALSEGGYVSRTQARELSTSYRFERVCEHRQ